MRPLRGFLNLLGSTDDDAARDDLRQSALPDVTPIAQAHAREQVRVAGVIASVTRSVAAESPRCVLVVSDGTGVLEVCFLGRRDIPGIAPGRVVAVSGRGCDQSGRLRMLNPAYQLIGTESPSPASPAPLSAP